MVEFSFGFSRVSSTPETVQKDRRMPVRFMGFPPLPSNKRPIYVIEQQNEAIYIQLNAGMVGRVSAEKRRVGSDRQLRRERSAGRLIETYQDFGLFLKDFSVRDEVSRVRARDIASMTYLADPFHGPSRHAWHCAIFRIGPWAP